jgi:aspartate racemase
MKTIGLIGGMTWLSSVEYYRLLNQKVNQRLGGIHSARLLMYSVEFDEISRLQREGRWNELATLFIGIARTLEKAGADCLMIGANTMHKLADEVQAAINIHLIHIGEATAKVVRAAGLKTVGLLGTKYTMELDFYQKQLRASGVTTIIPLDDERWFVHDSIYNEFGKGIFKDETKRHYIEVIKSLVARGCEGVILGCTEIPLLIKQSDSPVPVFDTTDIHASAAVEFALNPEPAAFAGSTR